jgi:hypothetical protein
MDSRGERVAVAARRPRGVGVRSPPALDPREGSAASTPAHVRRQRRASSAIATWPAAERCSNATAGARSPLAWACLQRRGGLDQHPERVAHMADALALQLVGRRGELLAAGVDRDPVCRVHVLGDERDLHVRRRSVAPGWMHAAVELPWARARA